MTKKLDVIINEMQSALIALVMEKAIEMLIKESKGLEIDNPGYEVIAKDKNSDERYRLTFERIDIDDSRDYSDDSGDDSDDSRDDLK